MKKIGIIVACAVVALGIIYGCVVLSYNKNDEENAYTEPKEQVVKSEEELERLTIDLGECDIVLNKIEAGSFQMGSYEGVGDEDELPVREVEITKDFYIGVYEITQAQWEAVMGSNPSSFVGENYPVETITWTQANEFCEKLSEISDYNVSLPTEAQWEYACRAGSTSKWFFGEDEAEFSKYCEDDIDAKTHEVGAFEPNGNGLYDIYGNVYEWCLDYYRYEYLEDDVTDPEGPTEGDARISRGGGWGGTADTCRSGYRNACGEEDATDGIGLRIVINP